ncbi:hypothetical protein C8R45DRAFT_937232 [Mycena sanguinolenta]|nr:hypothetical protein C8R45DRAFT_937232 [Mycena sanguinolenta]
MSSKIHVRHPDALKSKKKRLKRRSLQQDAGQTGGPTKVMYEANREATSRKRAIGFWENSQNVLSTVDASGSPSRCCHSKFADDRSRSSKSTAAFPPTDLLPTTLTEFSLRLIKKLFLHVMRANVAVSGSQEETVTLVNDLADIASEHHSFLLPVLYSALNPERIPAILARFDSSGWESVKWDVSQAHCIPPAAFADLWGNVWPWIAFLEEYEESFPCDDLSNEITRYRKYVAVIRFINTNEALHRLVHTAPGLYIVIGRAWRHLLNENSEGLYCLSYLLGEWFQKEQWTVAAFEDLIAGCGGVHNFAATVVSHIQQTLPSPDSPITGKTIHHLTAVVSVVRSGDVPEHRRQRESAIQDVFRSCGIVTALTMASRALCKSALENAEFVLRPIFFALLDHIVSFPPLWLNESLRAGLLDVVLTPHHGRIIVFPVRRLLEDILIPAAVYHSVLVQLRICLEQMNTTMVPWWPQDHAITSRAQKFAPSTNSAVAVDVLAHTTVPQNVKPITGNTEDTVGCVMGFHLAENVCSSRIPSQLIIDDVSQVHYSRNCSRDRAFLRFLMHHEYTTRKEEITQKRLDFMQRYPQEIPCAVFDFTTPSCEVVIGPLKGVAHLFRFEAKQTARVIGDAGAPRLWPFPISVEVEKGRKATASGAEELSYPYGAFPGASSCGESDVFGLQNGLAPAPTGFFGLGLGFGCRSKPKPGRSACKPV